ncbi:hypothetical protein FS749_010217 [Ceratobasidium sp. UAMH 11750]|nr:hypothetical protein FS749_010217 [Ceratobasidium sp. UAMH 11750]
MKTVWALSGFYKLVFLHLEPVSTMVPAVLCFSFPGATWFYNQLIPGSLPESTLNSQTRMAVWQLANCYMLLSLISSLVFRAIRDALPHDLAAQEKIVKANLIALAIADFTHVTTTFVALPHDIASRPDVWNATTHGNITFTIFLFLTRVAWLLHIGRPKFSQRRKAH